jgi:hypothetical protein
MECRLEEANDYTADDVDDNRGEASEGYMLRTATGHGRAAPSANTSLLIIYLRLLSVFNL